MFLRRATRSELVADGELVVSYVDAMMSDKKEDGFATLSAIYLALKQYKQNNPWITHVAAKTDGAGAYAGMVFTVGLSMMAELVGIKVTDHYIGESGKNKTALDGHFGVKGSQVRRLVAAALKDIITPEDLYEGVKMTLGQNEAVQSFMPVRAHGSDLDAKSISHLSAMSHRTYEYGANGELTALVLRQQTALGPGLCVRAAELRKPETAPFAPPRLLASAGATSSSAAGVTSRSAAAQAEEARARRKARGATGCAAGGAASGAVSGAAGGAVGGAPGGAAGGAARGEVDGAAGGAAGGAARGEVDGAAGGATGGATGGAEGGATGGAEGGAEGEEMGVGKPSVVEAPLPVARDRQGRERAEGLRAQRRLQSKAKAQQREAAQLAAELVRCRQSRCLWCRCDTRGHPYCNFTVRSAERLEKHIKVGKHTEGKLAPFAAGVAADRGSGHDRDAKVVHRALTAGASSSSSRLVESNQALKVLADGFVLTYSDGLEYEQKVPEHGWARAQRLPTERSTPAQLEFIYHAFTIGDTFPNIKFQPVEAQQIMAKVGTAEVANRFPGHPYFGVVLPKPLFSRTAVLEDDKIKSYFGKGAAQLKRLHENAQARGAVEEDDELDSDVDHDGLPRPEKRRKRASGGGGGGRAAGNAMAATDAVCDATPLNQLSSKLVLFSGIGTKVAANIVATTGLTTCGELARAEPQDVDKWKVPRFTRLRELRDALRRWLVDGERGAATSSSSSADTAPTGGDQGRGGAAGGAGARGTRGRGRGRRGRGRVPAAAADTDGNEPAPLSLQRSRRTCYTQAGTDTEEGIQGDMELHGEESDSAGESDDSERGGSDDSERSDSDLGSAIETEEESDEDGWD